MAKKIGTANFIGNRYYNLEFHKKYLLEFKDYGVLVYDMEENYICISRTDAFDNIVTQ